MAQFELLLWERHSRRITRARVPRAPRAAAASAGSEWTAGPLGRLGRPLLREIEVYLEFFALAHAGDGGERQRSFATKPI